MVQTEKMRLGAAQTKRQRGLVDGDVIKTALKSYVVSFQGCFPANCNFITVTTDSTLVIKSYILFAMNIMIHTH